MPHDTAYNARMDTYSYLIGLAAVSGLLVAWFSTGLPLHAFHMLRRLGWLRGNPFWDMIPEYKSGMDDLVVAMAAHQEAVHPLVADLLTCRVCFSYHLSFWVSLAFSLVLGWDVCCFFGALLSWPVLSNLAAATLNKLNR